MENREAIELIKRVRSGDTCPPGWETLEAFDMAISALKKQEQDRWIPRSVRLPEEKWDWTREQQMQNCPLKEIGSPNRMEKDNE